MKIFNMKTLDDLLGEIPNVCPSLSYVALDSAHVLIGDVPWLNFTSHDYLGLALNGELKKGAMKALLHNGTGVSQLAPYISQQQLVLEEELVAFLDKEAIILTSSHAHAELNLLHALTDASSIVCYHHQRPIPPHFKGAAFPYQNVYDLERVLALPSFSKIIQVPFPEAFDPKLIAFADRVGALVFADVTEVLGVIDLHSSHTPHILLGSFSHALGSSGAFIACSRALKQHVLNTCPMETSLPAATIGSIGAALDLLSQMEGEQRQLEQRAFWIRKKISELGLTPLPSPPHFVKCTAKHLASLQPFLEQHHVKAVFHLDSVTFVLTVDHTLEDIHHLIELLHVWSKASETCLEVAMQSATDTPDR